MIPKTLKFRAFESYVEEQFVDFSALSENGIFLINGETGSGKTAILDAMTYALYGETSGGSRGDVRSLHTSVDGISTEVEFVFELRGVEYKFTRSIKVRERGSKITVSTEQDALFYDGNNFIPFEPNPTKSRVFAKATEILGLTLDQFRQVIILPQGQFEKFLTSESGEKEQILSTLFDTEKFSRISEILYIKSRQRLAKLNVEKEIINSLLVNEGFSNFQEISEFLTEINIKNVQAKLDLESLTKQLQSEKLIVSKAEISAKLFAEKELAETENDAINLKSTEINSLSSRLKNAQAALKISSIFNEYNKSFEDLNIRKKSFISAGEQEKVLQAQNISIKSELDALLQKEITVQQTEQKLIQLKQLIPAYTEIEKSQNYAEIANKAFISAQDKVNKNQSDENFINEEIKELTISSNKLLVNFVQKIPALTARKSELTAIRAKVSSVKQLRLDLRKMAAELSEMNKQISVLELEIAQQKIKFDDAYILQLDNLTDFIAKSLKDGTPCPVCGSTEHPNIHNSTITHSEYNTKQLKAELDVLQKNRDSLVDKRNALQSKIDTKEMSIANIMAEIPAGEFNDEDLIKATANLELALRAEQKLSEINAEIARLRQRLEDILSEKGRLEKVLYELQGDALTKKSNFESLKASLNPNILDSKALEKEILDADRFIDSYKIDFNRLNKKYTDLTLELTSAQTMLKQAAFEAEKAEDKYKTSESSFKESLAENGFSSLEDFASNNLTDAEISYIQQQITGYQNKRYAIEKQLCALNSKLKDESKPDLERIHNEYDEHQQLRQKASDALAISQNEEIRIGKISKDYADRFEKYTSSIENATRYKEFSELLQGSRGLSFTRYVLGVMLSLITTEANRLLRDVHGGQFQIFRKTEGSEKNRKTGLDLEVQSAMAVSKFSVKNLSGGEKFLISLALSMALSSILQSQSGGISIEAMFIDEGFGSLDQQSLHEAMGILSSIKGSRRTIGIISHVSELKEIIPSRIDVKKDIDGSHLKVIV